jgi:hypothetical protein
MAHTCPECLRRIGTSPDCFTCQQKGIPSAIAAVKAGNPDIRRHVIVVLPDPTASLSPSEQMARSAGEEAFEHHLILRDDNPEFKWVCHLCDTHWLDLDEAAMAGRCLRKRKGNDDAALHAK